MNRRREKIFAALLAVVILAMAVMPVFASEKPFDDKAYATILTGSDFQDLGTKAYDRFGRVLTLMKQDGMPTPDSMLVGGDYTKVLFDYAVPGISLIRQNLVAVYPDADPESVVCIQGNHDNMISGFTKTGFYDMGVYCLYCINEDDFPWQQGLRPYIAEKVKSIANDMETHLTAMIEAGDQRPVIVMTHLPLHHTTRANYADNKYAAYLFNVLNEAAKTLDVVFIFGHQHSGSYDDYIGGSVNFMQAGDSIRIPIPDAPGEDGYTEETLNFTYTNCGYIGYANNTVSETSTNVLTIGAIQLSADSIRFVKYAEDGLFMAKDVARINPATDATGQRTAFPSLKNADLWNFEKTLFEKFFAFFRALINLFIW